MSAESKTDLQLEIAHVLCSDIVGYSKLLVNEQSELVRQLNQIVRRTEQFRKAEAAGKLIRIATGDGMALAFFTSPDAPVRCAVEIGQALREHPQLRLRMGIHSGPVDQVTDVNDQSNVAGTGINIAQRVMDCGDAGHILLTKRAAEDLAQYSQWRPYLHDLGEVEVKHGVRLNVVNLYTEEVGNAELPEKLKREAAAIARKRRNFIALVASALAVLALAAVFFMQRVVATKLEKSIAVLPFENRSDDKENTYFADGVQDEILTDLAKVADLKVISRRSAAQYRGSTKDVREIGRALGVAYVLEGSVGRAAGMVHVTAQLIDTRSEAQTWADKFDRQLADVFAIQSEIAQTIVTRLKAALSPAEKASIEQRPTEDLEAYDLYLRAKELMRATDWATDPKWEEKLTAAVSLLEKAVARDSKFVLAYCLLTEAHLELYGFHEQPAHLPFAEASLEAALRLAPEAGETRLTHAVFFYRAHRDYDHALEQLEIAEHSMPNSVDVFLLSAQIERRLGRWTESARHFVKASELDPRNFILRSEVCRTYGMMRRYSDAIRTADRAIADFPEKADIFRRQKADFAVSKGDLKLARATLEGLSPAESMTVATMLQQYGIAMLLHDYDEADRVVAARAQFPHHELMAPDSYFAAQVARARGDKEKARALFLAAREGLETRIRNYPNELSLGWWLSDLSVAEAALGHKEQALRASKNALESQLAADPLERPGFLIDRATVYCWLGERDQALQQLEELAKIPNGETCGDLRFNPTWDSLRGDPRFEKIVASLAPK